MAAVLAASPVASAHAMPPSEASATTPSRMTPVGDPCPINGRFGYASGGITICRDKVVVFAAPSDIPRRPTGGYLKRPSWYPYIHELVSGYVPSTRNCAKRPVRFTSMIVPEDELSTIVPYGGMFTAHVTPTDHAYVGINPMFEDPATRTEDDYIDVLSPAAGRVVEIHDGYRFTIDHGCGVYSVYMVVERLAGPLAQYAEEVKSRGFLAVNVPVAAGMVIGRQRDSSIDYNVFAASTWLRGLANPYSYAMGEGLKPYTADPRPFFTSRLRSLFNSQLQRTSEPRIGRIDHDVAGTAAGSWFLDGTIGYNGRLTSLVAHSSDPQVLTAPLADKACVCWGHLAIAPHWVDPSAWIVSLGSWRALDGSDADQRLIKLSPGQPSPHEITAASGMVVYQIGIPMRVDPPGWVPGPPRAPDPIGYTITSGPGVVGLLAVQVNDDGTLSLEVDLTRTEIADFPGFTSAKRIFHR